MSAVRRLALRRAARCLALLSIVVPAAAQNVERSIKLNDPLGTEGGGGVVEGRISPDGDWIVYLASQDSGVPGLFSAPIDGSAPSRRLVSADIGAVAGWEVSARDELVYSDWHRLYVVPLDGSRDPLALTQEEDGLVHSNFQVSADGAHVVYFTLHETGNVTALKSISTDGRSAPVQLFGPGILDFTFDPQGESIGFFSSNAVFVSPIDGSGERKRLNPGGDVITHYRPLVFSPAGDRLLYCARHGSLQDELWSAPVDGSQPAVKLNGPLQPNSGGGVYAYVVSADGTRVLYGADQEVGGGAELYSVPIDGSQPGVKINGATGVVGTFGFEAGTLNAIYLSDAQDGDWREPEIYLAPTDASAPPRELLPRIEDPLFSFPPFLLAQESRRVVYRAEQGGLIDLYSVPLGHGETVQLTHASDPGGGPLPSAQLTPDGRTVVYLERVAPFDATWLELRAIPVDGTSDAVVLGGPFRVRGGSSAPQIAPDGKNVVLRIGLEVAGIKELYSAPLDGHRPFAPVHPPLVTEQIVDDVESFEISADGRQALFVVHVRPPDDDVSLEELYSVQLGPGAVPVLLHATSTDHYITAFEQSGGNVVFVEKDGDSEPPSYLRSVPADGSGPAVMLAGPSPSTRPIPFHVSPDGNRVVFIEYEYETRAGTVRAVPAAGGPAIDLSDPLVEGGEVLNSRLSPDGSRVVWTADALVDEVIELFSAPVDGSAAPVRLNPPFVVGRNILTSYSITEAPGYVISPDGSTVVYLADQEQNERFELYRVPIDGSAAPVKLSGALVTSGDVSPSFQISPDGQWIVYVADQLTNNRNELFAGPLDGSSPALRVSGPLVAGGQVQPDFQLDPVRPRVVYRADQLAGAVFELFSVALDGSEPALALNGPLAPEDDVSTGFVVGPDGTRVLFRAGSDEDQEFELFGATLGVAHSAVKLSGDLAAGRTVLETLHFSSNGALALFAADLEVDERFELWAAPSGGSGKPQRIHEPFVPGGDVVRPHRYIAWEYELPAFEPVPGRASVVYLADQDDDEAVELYLGRLVQPRATPFAGQLSPRRGR